MTKWTVHVTCSSLRQMSVYRFTRIWYYCFAFVYRQGHLVRDGIAFVKFINSELYVNGT